MTKTRLHILFTGISIMITYYGKIQNLILWFSKMNHQEFRAPEIINLGLNKLIIQKQLNIINIRQILQVHR